MKKTAYRKNLETTGIKATGVDEDRFVVQFGKEHPRVRLYERKTRGGITVHSPVNQFYKMKRAVQCSWALSQEKQDEV